MVHPMMIILALLSLPLILFLRQSIGHITLTMGLILLPIFLSASAPSFLYVVSQKYAYKDWKKRCLFIPILMFIGCGVAINNTKAVLEALLNIKSDFIRTPKYGIVKKGRKSMKKNYSLPTKFMFIFEIALSIYSFIGFMHYANKNEFIFAPFLLMYTIGFLYVGVTTIIQEFKKDLNC